MASSPYFNKVNHTGEQRLLSDLVTESIAINGLDVYYIPRNHDSPGDPIFGENVLSQFTDKYLVTIYVNEGNLPGGNLLLDKFGLNFEKYATLVVSRQSFRKTTKQDKPIEGDLIFDHLTQSLYEIKYIKEDDPFFQFGKNYTWKLECERFVYSHEKINTGMPEIDDIARRMAYSVELVLGVGTGSYTFDESVSIGNVAATVADWNAPEQTLRVSNLTGNISSVANVVGLSSGATWNIASIDYFTSLSNVSNGQNQDFANVDAEFDLTQFNEQNPFGGW